MRKEEECKRYALYDGHSELGYLSYHCKQCSKALDDNKISLGRKILSNLLEKFPEDDFVKLLNFRINFFDCNYDACKEIFNSIEDKGAYLLSGLSLYIYLRDYDNILKLYNDYMFDCENMYDKDDNEFLNNVYFRMKIFIEKSFGLADSMPIREYSYSMAQQLFYSEEEALNHIHERHGINAPSDSSKFREDIDIKKLYDDAKVLIERNPEARFMCRLQERYLIYYPNIGYAVDRETEMLNYLVVGVNYESNEIITMFPTQELGMKVPVIDYRSLYEDNNDRDIKILSRIDKFNNKYNR